MVRISLVPSDIQVHAGESFVVEVRIENVTSLFAARCDVQHSANVSPEDPPAVRGDFLSEDALFLAVAEPDLVSIGMTEMQTQGRDGRSGSGTFASIRLRAVAAGSGPLGLASIELIDETGAPVASEMEIIPASVMVLER
jgi:hypothetical protein